MLNPDLPKLEPGEGMLVVDIDGTLCPVKGKDEHYADLVPYPEMVEKLREYQNRGYTIMLYTARNMKTHGGNLGKINMHTAPLLLKWIEKWDIPCDEIMFGKPWPQKKGFYIDDRSIRPDEFLKYSEEEIHQMLGEK
ncbi:capsular biosynthesis protein [Teredinibacter sp. KSP-S5-2]|uniref:capsular biosynthesis protein n=1 Tax=Teredinibacter sp. KSP-S5-2 TaxID=3034506 RepID=UPI0029345222|nr:capsular biosynthesis protein [Teredinibacter sp. KSP-S5-2]WNO07563.1 capsular biosynthesis protein [Teredinibacter sp. KSP-S5-2]